MAITITDKEVLVNGEAVATIHDTEAFTKLRDALLADLRKTEAVFLTVSLFGEAITSEIANFLGLDRSNTGKVLEDLEQAGRLELVDDAEHNGGRGRPSRLWAVPSNG